MKLDGARPDAIGEALVKLREIAGEYDQTGEGSAAIVIESWQELPLTSVMEDFEEWLYQHQIGLGCEMGVKRPGLRPEMISVLRARHATPMDESGWEAPAEGDEVLITPAPFEPLQLAAPADWVEGEITADEDAAPVATLHDADGWGEHAVSSDDAPWGS